MSSDRKMYTRKLSRMVWNGLITEEEAAPYFQKQPASVPKQKKEPMGRSSSSRGATGWQGASSSWGATGWQAASSSRGATEWQGTAGQRWKEEDAEDTRPEYPKIKQFKGEGKGGSLGLPVGSKSIVVAAPKIPPAPKAHTKESAQEMFDIGYYSYPETLFWDGKDIWNVSKGTHCLWKNVPKGKRGGDSTKTEVFHGEVHGWEGDDVLLR